MNTSSSAFVGEIVDAEFMPTVPRLLAFAAAGICIVMVGLIDDRFHLRGRQKLLGQFVAAGLRLRGSQHRVDPLRGQGRCRG